MQLPSLFVPSKPAEFVGVARAASRILTNKAQALRKERRGTLKALFYGPPGVGKTCLANMTAAILTNHPTEIESLNGRNVTIDLVRRWQESAAYGDSLMGGWTVKIVNELDLCTPQAQDLLLTYLDELPERFAFLGTSNLQLDLLQERFQTRLQQFKITAPEQSELAAFLSRRWKLAKSKCEHIALSSGGNVRAALLDTETHLDAASL